jgi:hypothetical protein
MPVDKTARQEFARAIEGYLSGTIDNFALDDVLFHGPKTDDVLCNEIAEELYCCYDNSSKHTNSGTHKIRERGEQALRRLVELLRSDTEWRWPSRTEAKGLLAVLANVFNGRRSQVGQNVFWPFSSADDWDIWRQGNHH